MQIDNLSDVGVQVDMDALSKVFALWRQYEQNAPHLIARKDDLDHFLREFRAANVRRTGIESHPFIRHDNDHMPFDTMILVYGEYPNRQVGRLSCLNAIAWLRRDEAI